ncbi:mannose-1-phosphate guanylyltransferase/mannose-6-phosphate isomerase [Chelatococcus sambhunathii]|uniref:mannose-1-phosphate guanylyltransferase n=1 Tax=Chelatococcus sambhunathii TaxID=363953 RepID=A0ABU1DDE5_9HYPH|nr:mannose-1-phosphate guanylyltransferase/mannose-6-phosphate isomerase [Chelatococcus sambhunathii]MDR4305960.1 mannose-1-phosphate guanylyltransferase/mannose-6-phosphate isomerase [Chelatococcus sambhunathii]
MSAEIVPLIVCGGSGTRLWPASRSSRPKQFLPLLGSASTFQETIRRVSEAGLFAAPVVVTNDQHRFLVADQLQEIGASAEIVLEPEARDSGPAILAGAMVAAARHGEDALVLALAADHFVRDAAGFRDCCAQARAAAAAGSIVTFGVAPDGPSTAYGYIAPGSALAGAARKVERFVEKPDRDTAAGYVEKGYLWNSGNFLFRADALIADYETREPETVEAVRRAVEGRYEDLDFTRLQSEAFRGAAKRSIDYAVMETTKRAAVVPAAFDWSDVGSWNAVRELLPQDGDGNAANGPAIFKDAHGAFVSSDGPLVAVVGLEDVSVIVTGDAVLVARRDDAVGVKALVEDLKASHRKLTEDHLQSFRPWGNYRSLDMGVRHQVKRIVVKPGGRLSLQKHHHRSEHWIVVRGTADVTVAGQVKTLHENESIYIPIGAIHRMENPGKIDLEIIEVQTGSYLGEDDIIRTEDIYNRAAS